MFRTKLWLRSILLVVITITMVLPNAPISSASVDTSAPAQIQGVTYELKSNVLDMPSGVSSGMYSADRRSLVLPKSLNSIKLPEGQIYIDKVNKSVIRVGDSSSDDQGRRVVQIDKPSITEVFADFQIPKQTVKLTEGNVKKNLVPGVNFSKASPSQFYSGPNNEIGVKLASTSLVGLNLAESKSFPITEGHYFDIVDLTILDIKSGGVSATVKANGYIMLGDPTITVEGEFNENFKIEFQAVEIANLKL